jgi:hypothetical protein
MLKVSVLITLLAIASLALAETPTSQQEFAGVPSPTATTACSFTFSSGAGLNFVKFCVTANGNITSFQSPAGVEDINVGTVGEGYGICDITPGTAYYDYAYTDSGNWNSPVTTSTATSVKVVRTTSDGIWTLTQVISLVPASARVTMTLKNNTAVARSVWLMRYADVDADGLTNPNTFDNTLNTAFGLKESYDYGLQSINATTSFPYDAIIQNTFAGPAPCSPFARIPAKPFVGDGSVAQVYLISVPASSSKAVTMSYKAF